MKPAGSPQNGRDGSAQAILDFASTELKLTLSAAQSEMLSSFVGGHYTDAIWCCGRRGGKSLLADILAIFDATMRDHLRKGRLRPTEPRTAAIIAQTAEKSARHISRCMELRSESPRLKRLIVSQGVDNIVLANGSQIQSFPCSARSIRGDAWSSVVLDEIGHFLTSEEGPAAGDRVYEAARPSLAQFGAEGWCLSISTPLWKKGRFWTLVQQATSGQFPEMHYRHMSTAQMNPTISTDWLENERKRDPDIYSREYLAQFIDGASAYLSGLDILACVDKGRDILPPRDFTYEASIDPAFSRDNFALAIGHQDAGTVIDGVWTWHRAGYEQTLDEIHAILKKYNVRRVRTDQFCEAPIREGLDKRGIEAMYEPWTNETKADAFGRLKAAINTRTVSLPDSPHLIEELCGLEARPTVGGKIRIAAAGDGHDDRAVVVASVVAALVEPEGFMAFIGGDDDGSTFSGAGVPYMGSARSFFRVRSTHADGTVTTD